MSDIISTIKRLPELESSGPVSNEEICSAEVAAQVKFAEDYRVYLSAFGAVCSSIIAVSGISEDKDYGVVELTNKLRSLYTKVPPNFYVIEDVGVDGLVIWQDEAGVIYQSVPCSQPIKLFDNLSDYLEYVIEG